MKALIRIGEVEATFSEGVWSCEDARLSTELNALLPTGGFSPSDPSPAHTAAAEAARVFHAQIVAVDSSEQFSDGEVY